MTSLRELDINMNNDGPEEEEKKKEEWDPSPLASLTLLTHLRVGYTPVANHSASRLVLACSKTITTLVLCSLSRDDFPQLFNVSYFAQLVSLELYNIKNLSFITTKSAPLLKKLKIVTNRTVYGGAPPYWMADLVGIETLKLYGTSFFTLLPIPTVHTLDIRHTRVPLSDITAEWLSLATLYASSSLQDTAPCWSQIPHVMSSSLTVLDTQACRTFDPTDACPPFVTLVPIPCLCTPLHCQDENTIRGLMRSSSIQQTIATLSYPTRLFLL